MARGVPLKSSSLLLCASAADVLCYLCNLSYSIEPGSSSNTMHQRLFLAAMLAATPLLALGLVASPPHHEAGCARPIAGNRYNHRLFRSLMHRRDKVAARFLAVYNVPRVSPLDVRPVSSARVCRRAALAYGQVVKQSAPDRKVHILRVGNRFIVMDPDYVVDNHHRAVTFDSTFTKAVALVAE